MTGSTKNLRVGRATKKKLGVPTQLSVALRGDQRLAENLILEVRAAAYRCGLEIPSIQIVSHPRVGPKARVRSGPKSKIER